MTAAKPPGFLAVPTAGHGRGVLVLHAWWGLNDTMKSVCTRLSDAGFTAYAPDLYHGKVATTVAEAEQLARATDGPKCMTDVAGAVDFLAERAAQGGSELAVIGFSFGAFYALNLSVADPERIRSVVVFYGTGPDDYSTAKAAYLGHFAEADEYESEAAVNALEDSLRAAGRPVTIHRYPGTGHWFFEPDRPDAYRSAAATLAWERTLAFLKLARPSRSG